MASWLGTAGAGWLKCLQDLPPAPPHPFVTDIDRQGRNVVRLFFVLMNIRYSANCPNDGYGQHLNYPYKSYIRTLHEASLQPRYPIRDGKRTATDFPLPLFPFLDYYAYFCVQNPSPAEG